MQLSLKLGALSVVALLPLMLASVVALRQLSSDSRARSIEQLQDDARAASSILEKRLTELRSAAQRLADEVANRAVVSVDTRDSTAAWARLQDMLPRAQNELYLDFLIVTDPQGRVVARHNERPATDETLVGTSDKNPVAEKVIQEGSQLRSSPVSSCVIEGGDRITKLGLNLRAQVYGPDNAVMIGDQGLMLEAGAPIFSSGRFIGVVLIGQMLNNDVAARAGASALQTPLVTEIKQTLFRNPDKDAGAMIALSDTVIASSLPAPGSGRSPALGGVTRDQAVTDEIIHQGDRSYAVSWQPIKTIEGVEVGAVGVAIRASELEGATGALRSTLLVGGLVAVLLAAGTSYWFGHVLAARLGALTEAADRMGLGELSAPVKDREGIRQNRIADIFRRDEITRLAEQLERMRESFRQAIERVRKR